MASHFCKDRCFLPRLPPPDSPTPSHLPAEGAGLEPGELQRRHPGDSSNPQTLPDFSASLRPCGKKSPPLPRATSRRGPPAETLGRREYPLQTTPPLRLCAPAGKKSPPHRVPPPDGILPQRRWDAGNTHSRQRPLRVPAPLRETYPPPRAGREVPSRQFPSASSTESRSTPRTAGESKSQDSSFKAAGAYSYSYSYSNP